MYEENGVWNCMLNQTNVSHNKNKFYVIQLLEEDSKKSYYVWFRWGRVGYNGGNKLVPCGNDLDAAKQTFSKKFADKTNNVWANRETFRLAKAMYDLLAMNYGENSSIVS